MEWRDTPYVLVQKVIIKLVHYGFSTCARKIQCYGMVAFQPAIEETAYINISL